MVAPSIDLRASESANKWMQTLAAALILALVAAILHMGAAPYIAFALTGAFVMHMAMRPARRDLWSTGALAAMFGAVYFLHHGARLDYFGWMAGLPGGFLGMGSLQVLLARWIWAAAEDKRVWLERVRDVALIPLLCVISMIAVAAAAELTPITYDRILYAFDLKFGGPPGWVIGKLLRAHPWFYAACGYVYDSLPLGLAACLAMQWRERWEYGRVMVDLRWLAIVMGTIGFLLYQVCPAAGPVYLFGKEFPFQVPGLAGLAIMPHWLKSVPRNGMPSLHVGWTMLLFWNMRRRVWIAAAAAVYLILTVFWTLGSGEHYLVDLMVAAPLALAVQAACTRTRRGARWAALTIGAAIALAWLGAFRTGAALAIPAGAVTWMLAALSLVVPALLAWRLAKCSYS